MSRNSRENIFGLFHHVMCQGINKEYIFNNDFFKEKYREILKNKCKENNIKILAYCIMDNHVHLLIKIEKIDDMSRFMKQVNTSYARLYNNINKRVGYVFRDRYLSKSILSEPQLKRCMVYIHRNPVEAQIVKNEKDYRYSSYNEYLSINKEENLISSDARKIVFRETSINHFEEEYIFFHKYKDINKKEFENSKEDDIIDIQNLLIKYCKLTQDEKIQKMSFEYNISERRLAEIFDISRYRIRKILNQGEPKKVRP